jgi:Type I phosphodiesterase / nucleotide pyrophosphatase
LSIIIAIDVPDLGRPETTTIGLPKRTVRFNRSISGEVTVGLYHTPSARYASRVGAHRRAGSWVVVAVAIAAMLVAPSPAEAYIGPGAGFAVLSSFFVIFTTLVIAIVSIVAWPFMALWRVVRGQTPPRSRIGRLIIVGLDGQDPQLTDRFLRDGNLPNFAKLADGGSYVRLRTTFPSVSPVAWSSFSTGTHPARHNIFDFLDRDRRTYLPMLSSTRIGKIERFFRLGRYLIPRHRPELRLLRKSKPFWAILGEHRIWSTILRVPVTFPPDRFYGA